MKQNDEAALTASTAEVDAAAARSANSDANLTSSPSDMIGQARALFDAALATFQSSLAVMRAEFALAKNSTGSLFALAAGLLVLAIGTWLALLALIAAAVYELVGNWFIGIGSVVLLNGIGIAWVALAMRQRLRDLTMPRTRAMLAGLKSTAPNAAEQRNEKRP